MEVNSASNPNPHKPLEPDVLNKKKPILVTGATEYQIQNSKNEVDINLNRKSIHERTAKNQQDTVTTVAEADLAGATNIDAEAIKSIIVEKAGSTNISIFEKTDGSYELTLDKAKVKNLVFSGGGAKGIAYPGVISSIEKAGMMPEIESCFGSSAGSLQAAIVAIGATADEIKKYSDTLNMGALLEEEKNFYKNMTIPLYDEKPLSRLGKIKAFIDSLLRLVMKSSSISLKYEAYTNFVIAKILLARMREHNLVLEVDLQDIVKKLKKQEKDPRDLTNTINFNDLSKLSKIMPEVKNLTVTATAQIDGRYQLLLFSKDSFSETPVSHAVMVSSSLPLLFPAIRKTDLLNSRANIKLMDGGCIMNTPHPKVIKQTFNNKYKKDDSLTFVFNPARIEGEREFSNFKNTITGMPLDAISAETHRLRRDFSIEEIEIPVTTYIEEKPVSISTLSFFITQENKDTVQQETELKITECLQNRVANQEKYAFSDLKTLLNSLEDKELKAIEDKNPGTCADIIEMRKLGYEAISNIISLISMYDEDNRPKNEKVNTIINELTKLNQKVKNETEFINWFSFVVNDSGELELKRFLELTKDVVKPNNDDFSVFNTIHDDRSKAEHRNKVFYIIREHIYPVLYRHEISNHNKQMIITGIENLLNSDTKKDIKAIMERLQNDYKKEAYDLFKKKDIFGMASLSSGLSEEEDFEIVDI